MGNQLSRALVGRKGMKEKMGLLIWIHWIKGVMGFT